MDIFSSIQIAEVVSMIFYTFLGLALLGACWWIVDRITPYSVTKEIENDQNVALAVLIGMLFLSLSIIIAAVIIS
ncbi:MAG: DUF350 domain-containing protein [Litoreibacter sp.]